MTPMLTAVDLFAGAGGATQGLRDAGINVLAAVENDASAVASYRMNHPDVPIVERDIRTIAARELFRRTGLRKGELTLIKACPPCQGFSSLAEGRASPDERRNDLVYDVIRFVHTFRPRAMLLENVPGLGRNIRLSDVESALSRAGYIHATYSIDAVHLGVPQRRRRLILIALRGRRRRLPESFYDLLPQGFDITPVSAGEALDDLSVGHLKEDPLNRYRAHRVAVRARIRAIPANGTRFDLPKEHQLACHSSLDSGGTRTATASYGRVRLDQPAPTMTTRCTTPACGSFIHPTEHRGLTLREAATFQTFPYHYQFAGGYDSIERQIGNAVPVRMAQALGLAVLSALGVG